ncbi:hypothetical protein, partial [Klebsiella pneumoniae]|uniref:hypothetical protein n=1 Tax=Klebsiella pneumoniae TaxID=573 RepID=UPI0033162629
KSSQLQGRSHEILFIQQSRTSQELCLIGSSLSGVNSLSTIKMRGERFLETGHSADTGASYRGHNQYKAPVLLYCFILLALTTRKWLSEPKWPTILVSTCSSSFLATIRISPAFSPANPA